MEKKVIPSFYGFGISVDEMYKIAGEDRLVRSGVKINTPDTCNWACPYCYVGSPEFQDRPRLKKSELKGQMSPFEDSAWLQKMKGWLQQEIEEGVRTITINGTFEPTMSPELINVLEHCKEKGIHATVVTNGSLLTDELIEILDKMEVSILLKMNVPMVANTDERYETFCEIMAQLSGKKGEVRKIYEDQKNIIEKLIKAGFNSSRKAGQTRLGVESVISSRNIQYLPELVSQLRELNIYAHIEVIKDQGFAENQKYLLVTKKEIQNLFEKVRECDIQMGYEDWVDKPPYIAGTCYQNLCRVDLHADGNIKPCPGIDIVLGNLNESPLKEVLKNKSLHVIRNLEKYIEGDCRECEEFKKRLCYGGCRGTVYQTLVKKGFSEYECLVASDPSCWRVREILDNGQSSDIFA